MSLGGCLLDTNVLFGQILRDTVLYLADQRLGLYTPYWSDRILNELEFNLFDQGKMTRAEAHYLIELMRKHYPDALVTPAPALIDSMTNKENDRHVLAAAVEAGAAILVTFDLGDFGAVDCEPYGIEVMEPGFFLRALYVTSPDDFVSSLVGQVARYENEPMTMRGLLETLRKQAGAVVYHLEEDFSIDRLETMVDDRRAEIREEEHERR